MSEQLKPCPFGSKGKTEIEGKGQIWRGVKGYSEPQYFKLCRHGRLSDGDTFPTVFVEIRARTEEQAREMWNRRADLAEPARVKAAADRLAEAGNAVVTRWDSPLWKDMPHTGESIDELRAALAAYKKATK